MYMNSIAPWEEITFENTGLLPFLEANDNNLAVANKIWWDNMWLMIKNRKVMELVWEQWMTQSYSVSAFRSSAIKFNTTDHLIQAWEAESIDETIAYLSKVAVFHTELLEEILKKADTKLRKRLIDYAQHLFNEYTSSTLSSENLENCTQANDYTIWVWEKAFSLLSVWEVIAAKMLVMYLQECWIPAVYVDTASLTNIKPHELWRRVADMLGSQFEEIFSKNPEAIPIIPGYIWGIEWGIIAKLGRWYTDYTWERAAVATHDTEKFDQVFLYIQKLYGFKSTDPRVLSESEKAKSVNHLSYDLTKRAISKKWAWAWLINEFALSKDIISKEIALLVWNPTNSTDKAYIDQYGERKNKWVNLVLWKDYSDENDGKEYGRRWSNTWDWNHNVYLMWENIKNIWSAYGEAVDILKANNLQEIAARTSNAGKPETSFVFRNKADAITAQRVLHKHFIEDRVA